MYHAIDASMIRASAFPLAGALPPWPDLDGDAPAHVERWRSWIAAVWADGSRAAAIEFAAPDLANAVRDVLAGDLCRPRAVRRIATSLTRYLLRMRYRATPFGLFAGAAPIRIGRTAGVEWGPSFHAFATTDTEWLHNLIAEMERDPWPCCDA